LNEVGGDPDCFGLTLDAFHERIRDRSTYWPHNMLATSTHDTKRSEDVRARLNVLSEIPGEWAGAIARWSGMNEPHRTRVRRVAAPDRNAEYLLYQTLVGTWPLNDDDHEGFTARIQAYMEKALREAKVHTSWINPNAEYDEAVRRFVAAALDPNPEKSFSATFERLPPASRWRDAELSGTGGPETDLPRRARHLSGKRDVGPEPGGSG
jgi:(1->4)-alpha-D-glucan 1-alpha-D-glucosylmutase